MKVCTKAASFRGEDEKSLAAWLYRIATNEALQVLRRRSRLFQSLDSVSEELSERVAAESAPDADKASILFQKALLRLPLRQRVAFTLRYYDGLPYDQIARITGRSEGSLRTNYHYAVNTIKQYMEEHDI